MTQTKAKDGLENHQYVNQDSGNTEWYTPRVYVKAAQALMGSIDLDPACSLDAWLFHERHSKRFYSENGLDRHWNGNVWMNHPFSAGEGTCAARCKKKACEKRAAALGRAEPVHITEPIPANEDWISRLVDGYECSAIPQACNITFAAMSAGWMTRLKRFPQFFSDRRVSYVDPVSLQEVSGCTKDSVFTWLYPHWKMSYADAAFEMNRVFAGLGVAGWAK